MFKVPFDDPLQWYIQAVGWGWGANILIGFYKLLFLVPFFPSSFNPYHFKTVS